jgi:hypothetical protein
MRRIAGIVLIALTATVWGGLPGPFRTRGPAGGNDEFVELRNVSSARVGVGGWQLQGCASGSPGNAGSRATIPAGTSLAPGQHYLLAKVSGRVNEYRAADTGLTTTELDRVTVTVSGDGDAIQPTIVGRGGRVPLKTVIANDGDVENGAPFDPDEDGIDFYESLEGMLTQVNRATVIEPTNTFSAGAANENSELAVLPDRSRPWWTTRSATTSSSPPRSRR